MDYIDSFNEFEAQASRLSSKYISFQERANLVKELDSTLFLCLRNGDSSRADSLLRHYSWLGGDTSWVLDRRGLIELEGDLAKANPALLARLVLRIAVDNDSSLEMAPSQTQKLRYFFTDIISEIDPAWALIKYSKSAVNWIFNHKT